MNLTLCSYASKGFLCGTLGVEGTKPHVLGPRQTPPFFKPFSSNLLSLYFCLWSRGGLDGFTGSVTLNAAVGSCGVTFRMSRGTETRVMLGLEDCGVALHCGLGSGRFLKLCFP